MKKIALFFSVVLAAVSLFGCSPYRTGVEYPDFPDRDIALYEDATVYEYDGDDEENEITYGVKDDADDVMEFYQELFEDEEYIVLDEKVGNNEYKAEGYIDDIYFEIEVEEADGDTQKYYDTIVNIKTEKMDEDDSRYVVFEESTDSVTTELSSEYFLIDNIPVSREFEVAELHIGQWNINGERQFQNTNKVYDSGLGMYIPSNSIAESWGNDEMTYNLNGMYEKIQFDIFVDTEGAYGISSEYGLFRIRMYADGELIYDTEQSFYDDFYDDIMVDIPEQTLQLKIQIIQKKGTLGTLDVVIGDFFVYPNSETNEEIFETKDEESIVIFHNKAYTHEQLTEFAELYTQETGVMVEVVFIDGYSNDYNAVLKDYLMSNSQLDIFTIDTMNQYNAFAEFIEPFENEEWMDETELELTTDGVTYGFPISAEAWGIAYNAEMLEQAGIDPESLTNIDAYRDAFATLDSMKDELGIDSVVAMAAGPDMTWVTGLHNFNGYLSAGLDYGDTTVVDQLNNGQVDMDRLEEYADWVELLFMYADSTVLTTGNYDAQVGQFANQKAAFIHQGNWIDPWLNSNGIDFKMGFAPHCSVAGEHNAIFLGAPSYYVINNQSENIDAANAFLSYMAMSEEGHNYMVNEAKLIPAFINVELKQEMPLAASIAEWLKVKDGAYTWLQNELPSGFGMGTLGPIYEAFANGDITKEEFIDRMAEAIESVG